MALTKKHFEQFALLVLNRKSVADNTKGFDKRLAHILEHQARATMLDLISICEADNPRFNRERFLRACGF